MATEEPRTPPVAPCREEEGDDDNADDEDLWDTKDRGDERVFYFFSRPPALRSVTTAGRNESPRPRKKVAETRCAPRQTTPVSSSR